MTVAFPAVDARYDTREKWQAMFDDVYEHFRHVPGVEAVTPVLIPPFLGSNVWETWFEVEGRPLADSSEAPHLPAEAGGPDYFRTMRIPILRGRAFTDADRAGAPQVVVVSESVARRYWPGQDPIGKRIRHRGDSTWRTVVGVAGDTHFRSLRESTPTLYYPASQLESQGFVAIRTSGTPGSVLPALRRVVQEGFPGVILWRAQTMDDFLAGPLAQPRLGALLLGVFGIAALLLAAIGLYGVMASAVRNERRDIGVRLALGATQQRIRRDVLGRALVVTGAGMLVGLACALAASRLLASMLFEVSPADPLAIAGACALLLVVAVVAAYAPARRATQVDPAEALRAD